MSSSMFIFRLSRSDVWGLRLNKVILKNAKRLSDSDQQEAKYKVLPNKAAILTRLINICQTQQLACQS
jgi:hypothetical protein